MGKNRALEIRRRVFESLANSIENGYHPRDIADGSAEQIAIDLNRHDADLERVPHDQLVEHVRAWLEIDAADRRL